MNRPYRYRDPFTERQQIELGSFLGCGCAALILNLGGLALAVLVVVIVLKATGVLPA